MFKLTHLSDEALLAETLSCATTEREKTAVLVAHLAEVYRRDLALKRGYPSLFKYAREALGLSDKMAYERTVAAQLAVQLPETLDRLVSGELSLDAAGELYRTLKDAERPVAQAATPSLLPVETQALAPVHKAEKRELLTHVLGKTRKESERILQTWASERRGEPVVPKPQTTELKFELTEDELSDWNKLRDLLSHKLGSRDSKPAFNWLLQLGLDKTDPARKEARAQKRVAPQRPKEETAHQKRKPLPAPLKRQIWLRDQGHCQHADPQTGRKCGATAFLDYDHIQPRSQGGSDHPSNLRLSCASHNRRRYFWDERDQMARRAGGSAARPPSKETGASAGRLPGPS
jgi:5-methylcytosine-specific restriction endonuclease McrA